MRSLLSGAVGERNLRPDRGALARRGFDGEAAADHLHPLAHAEQPQTLCSFLVGNTPLHLERICRCL